MRCLPKNSFAKFQQVSILRQEEHCRRLNIVFFLRLESIQTQGIRFRLYSNERFKREKLLAESTVMFGLVNLDEDMCKIIPLERAYVISSSHHCELNMLERMGLFFQPSDDSDLANSRSRASSNAFSRQNSTLQSTTANNSLLPELEIGLAYDKNQSTLILEIGKGINFGMALQGRAPGRLFFIDEIEFDSFAVLRRFLCSNNLVECCRRRNGVQSNGHSSYATSSCLC